MKLDKANAADDFLRNAQGFAEIHVGRSTEAFASNIHTRIELLHAGDFVMPVTINEDQCDNTWVCSPNTTYSDYAAEEAVRYTSNWLRSPIKLVFACVRILLRLCRIDRVVAINNWLLSTNMYPALANVPLDELVANARKRWPDYALCFRSLNELENAEWLEALTRQGFQLVASRQVYLYGNIASLATKHLNLKRDLDFLEKTRFLRIANEDIDSSDYVRIAELYYLLNIKKHSHFNPQYTAEFMQRWHQAGLLQFEGLRDANGQLQGVAGMFQHGTAITAPIFGYNTAMPQKAGLYRLLAACVYQKTMQSDGSLNFSAGAAEFKRLRGGIPAIEYSAFYVRELPVCRRLAFTLLSWLTCRIGKPLMIRYRL